MFTTFELEWPWIGLGAGAVLAIMLFATDVLRVDRSVSRWRDPAWIGWIGALVYLLHNVEEYGIAADGVVNAFPDELCTMLGLGAYPGCAIPTDFFAYVNITLVWLVAPACAILARRHVIFGFVFYGVVFVNVFVHVGGAVAAGSSNPGLITALALFLPASIWAGIVFLQRREPRLRVWRLVAIVALGVVAHGVLILSIVLFTRDVIPAWVLDALQVVNGLLVLFVGGLLQRSLRTRPEPAQA
jgi:hypothetical protein